MVTGQRRGCFCGSRYFLCGVGLAGGFGHRPGPTQRKDDMTTPTPEPSTEYPSAWRPAHIRARDEQRTEFELHVAALSDEDLERIRGDR